MPNKKIVIIGGGISGLTAGVYAKFAGYDVEIYEKNAVPGGECTGWDRHGYHIDNCIHWLMGTTKGSKLYQIWSDTGALGSGVEVIHPEKMYTSELNGESLTLWSDAEKTREEMLKLSHEDKDEINRLFAAVREGQNVQIPAAKPAEMMTLVELGHMMHEEKSALRLFHEFKGMSTEDLAARFRHPLIRAAITDFCTKESLGHSFPTAYGNFVSGDGGVPAGGSRAMALRMQKRFESGGGKIFLNSPVASIKLSGNKAIGVVLENGSGVFADYIIAACDTDFTFSHLLDASYMPDLLKEMYENRAAYPVYGMFQAAYAVDSAKDCLFGEHILDAPEVRFAEWVSDRMTVKSYAYEPSFAPEGKQIIQVLLGLREEGYEWWMNLASDKAAYDAKKTEIALSIQQKLEERFPEYAGKLTLLDAWTPVTYKRFCNAYKGYNQAFMVTKESAKNPYPSPFVKGIDNVVLAGQWICPPGGLPSAAITGKFAIQRICRMEKRNLEF